MVPAAAWALARLVATTGRTAVNNTDLVTFFLSPTGIAVGVLIGIAALSATLFQTTGVLAVGLSSLIGTAKITPRAWGAGTPGELRLV